MTYVSPLMNTNNAYWSCKFLFFPILFQNQFPKEPYFFSLMRLIFLLLVDTIFLWYLFESSVCCVATVRIVIVLVVSRLVHVTPVVLEGRELRFGISSKSMTEILKLCLYLLLVSKGVYLYNCFRVLSINRVWNLHYVLINWL